MTDLHRSDPFADGVRSWLWGGDWAHPNATPRIAWIPFANGDGPPTAVWDCAGCGSWPPECSCPPGGPDGEAD